MDTDTETEDIRWQVIKKMLEEFPNLKEKTRSYLREEQESEL